MFSRWRPDLPMRKPRSPRNILRERIDSFKRGIDAARWLLVSVIRRGVVLMSALRRRTGAR
jgi:hypothetical protein